MTSMIIVMNTILEKEFRNGTPITPVKLNAMIYFTQLSSIRSGEDPVLGYEQFIIGESFPLSVSFSAKFSGLNLHDLVTFYVTDAAGNKEVYQDGDLNRHILVAGSVLHGLQDHQVITMITHPDTSWFRYRYPERQEQALSMDDLRHDSRVLLT